MAATPPPPSPGGPWSIYPPWHRRRDRARREEFVALFAAHLAEDRSSLRFVLDRSVSARPAIQTFLDLMDFLRFLEAAQVLHPEGPTTEPDPLVKAGG